MSAALLLMLLIAVGGFGYVTFRGGRIADLRDGIEEALQAEDWTPGDLEQAEALIDRLGQWDPQQTAEDSLRLHEQYADAIRRAIQQPKLFRQEIAQIKTQLKELAVRDPGLAAVVRAELEQRSADWQLLFELKPPFDKLEEVFDEKQVTAQRDVLLSRGPKTLTSLHCPARARIGGGIRRKLDRSRSGRAAAGCACIGTRRTGRLHFPVECRRARIRAFARCASRSIGAS